MCNKFMFLVSFVLLLALTSNTVAQLDPTAIDTGHIYLLEDVSGTEVPDDSANDLAGTIVGDPQVVVGIRGNALQFDGVDDGVTIPDSEFINITGGPFPNRTIIAVFSCADVDKPEKQTVFEEGGRTRGLTIYVHEGLVYVGGWNRAEYDWNPGSWISAPITSNQWVAVALIIRDGTEAVEDDRFEMWMDGKLIGTAPGGHIHNHSNDNSIGYTLQNNVFHDDDGSGDGWYFEGMIDEVWILNQALTEAELSGFVGKPWPFASSPSPADGAFNMDTWATLSWRPSNLAVTHDVYFGENFDDVDSGAEGTLQGNQATTEFIVGFPGFPVPEGLVPGTTYYWRIDEVNEAEPNSPWKGSVWSFAIPPKIAYLPDPADGAEGVSVDARLSWTAGFGAILHYAYFGDNFDDVSNAAGALPLGETTLVPGPLKMAKTYYWRVDEFDAAATHKGNVWSFITEGAVATLNPVNGAVDVSQTPVLTWAPGLGASHEVYFGADEASLELKGSGNLGSESFEPGQLEWNTTYYWRVDEVNNANADSPWTGPLWSFTTANFLIIDDMESYNDLDEGEPGSNRIYLAWVDGFENPAINGSVVGNLNAPFAEQTIVHSGNQSMPMAYDNAVGKSEATLTSNNDWTVNGVNTLTIWFRGSSSNAAEQMYVVLNGSAGIDNDNPDAAQATGWNEWNIDLQAFADQGVNLTNVTSITLGLGNRANPVAGGSGMIYYDDIRLYPPTP